MKYLVLIAVLLATGCSSSGPTLKQYLLRTDTPSQYTLQDSTGVVGIGGIVVASYINDLGLVLETSNGEVRVARDHQWAEPLRESLRSFLSSKISEESGQVIRAFDYGKVNWSKRIDIRIDELHGTANGDAKLVAYWTIIDPAERTVLSESGFHETEPLGHDGYDALVQAEKKLLRRLASAISATL
jgi:uncharacterized lipoprotein YmbA